MLRVAYRGEFGEDSRRVHAGGIVEGHLGQGKERGARDMRVPRRVIEWPYRKPTYPQQDPTLDRPGVQEISGSGGEVGSAGCPAAALSVRGLRLQRGLVLGLVPEKGG